VAKVRTTITLDDELLSMGISKINFIKMDIEGSEYDVFDKSMNFIKKNVKSLFIELHNIDKQRNIRSFKRFIVKHGFTIEAEIMNRTIFVRNSSIY